MRLGNEQEILAWLPAEVALVRTRNYKVTVRMTKEMPVAERGHLLLELEKQLHRAVDDRIEVFLEPLGDMNKLRAKLRGVVVQ